MKNIISHLFLTSLILVFTTSCDALLEVEDPIDQLPSSQVFNNESTADAAIATMYAKLRDDTLLTGNLYGLNIVLGLYSDELNYYGHSGLPLENFHLHTILSSNAIVNDIWGKAYHLIYMSNTALEGLNQSTNLPNSVKKQLIGESLFIRALTHFYLNNLFGDIPYIKTTNYLDNQVVSKLNQEEIFQNILTDLIAAKNYLSYNYTTSNKTRANKLSISAFLSRVYLYNNEIINAEIEATEIINSSHFEFEENINDEFLSNSSSTILQLHSQAPNYNTHEANIFIFESGPPSNVALNPSFYFSFENNDLRKENWIKVLDNNGVWFLPYKYKQKGPSNSISEYSIIFRLAEQYLIRSEARLLQGNIQGSLEDLNKIRSKAGLNELTTSNFSEIFQHILEERRHELFTEHGHRWFDLKRANKADEVLSPIKINWRPTNIIFPIPENEILINPYLNPQNPGY